MIADWWTQPVNCGDVAAMTETVDPGAVDQTAVASRIIENWLAV